MLVSADVTLMLLGLIRMFQWALFFTNCVILGTIMFTGHALTVYRQVETLLSAFSALTTTMTTTTTTTRMRRARLFGQKKRSKIWSSVLGGKTTKMTSTAAASSRRSSWLALHSLGAVAANSLAEHNKVCYVVVRGSVDFFGGVLLAFLCTHLPVNVFLLRRNLLLSRSVAQISEVIPWTIVLFQALAAVIVFGPLAWCAKVYHHPRRYIPRLMMLMRAVARTESSEGDGGDQGGDNQGGGDNRGGGGDNRGGGGGNGGNSSSSEAARQFRHRWLLLQMKYDDLYGRLLRGPKIAINIGPVESITFRTALEVSCCCCFYIKSVFTSILSTCVYLTVFFWSFCYLSQSLSPFTLVSS